MVKLQAAKCPSCGADIQVNEKLENTICQYCGSTVLVEDAIEKYKIEISGNVKVEGIKGRNDKIEQAKKHFNCSSINKVPLENQGGDGSVGSHWESRYM